DGAHRLLLQRTERVVSPISREDLPKRRFGNGRGRCHGAALSYNGRTAGRAARVLRVLEALLVFSTAPKGRSDPGWKRCSSCAACDTRLAKVRRRSTASTSRSGRARSWRSSDRAA